MGAGILPTTIYKNKLYFLFGKENKYEDTAPGFSDFGGGTDNKETYMETAIREGGEELTGFLGSDEDLKKMLERNGTYNIDNKTPHGSIYRVHIFPMTYDPLLPFYYNNNQRFLQKRLEPEVIKKTKIFEKEEIRWVCVDEIKKMKPQFRFFFKPLVDRLYNEREDIKKFIAKGLKLRIGTSNLKKRTSHNKTRKIRS
jgi:8-oxo-dGTP pyrophosphatase MutT (NUDIX family)